MVREKYHMLEVARFDFGREVVYSMDGHLQALDMRGMYKDPSERQVVLIFSITLSGDCWGIYNLFLYDR